MQFRYCLLWPLRRCCRHRLRLVPEAVATSQRHQFKVLAPSSKSHPFVSSNELLLLSSFASSVGSFLPVEAESPVHPVSSFATGQRTEPSVRFVLGSRQKHLSLLSVARHSGRPVWLVRFHRSLVWLVRRSRCRPGWLWHPPRHRQLHRHCLRLSPVSGKSSPSREVISVVTPVVPLRSSSPPTLVSSRLRELVGARKRHLPWSAGGNCHSFNEQIVEVLLHFFVVEQALNNLIP